MSKRVVGPSLVALGAAGFTACLVSLYAGMRDVMRTSGGFCASGGPYVIAHQCQGGDVRLIMVGFLGGLLSAGILAGATSWLEGPVLGAGLLMWTALFGSLGWNFIYFAVNPPGRQAGTGGWIASGAVFWLMALGGLIPVLVMTVNWLRRGGEPEPPPPPGQPLVKATVPGAVSPSDYWSTP